jgi:hypothetical protein
MAKYLVNAATIKYTGEFAKYSSEQRKGKPDGVKFGKRTGLSLTAYVDELLVANEKAQESDSVLAAELQGEFPNRPACQTISAYRGYHNTQKHGFNAAGKYRSMQYGRNTGESAVKPRKDLNHPNMLANRTADYGVKKPKAAKAATGKAAKPAKAVKPVGKAAKPAKAAAPKAKAAKAAKPAKPAASAAEA